MEYMNKDTIHNLHTFIINLQCESAFLYLSSSDKQGAKKERSVKIYFRIPFKNELFPNILLLLQTFSFRNSRILIIFEFKFVCITLFVLLF